MAGCRKQDVSRINVKADLWDASDGEEEQSRRVGSLRGGRTGVGCPSPGCTVQGAVPEAKAAAPGLCVLAAPRLHSALPLQQQGWDPSAEGHFSHTV